MRYARIENNVAVEVFTPQDGFTIEESMHPDLATLFVEVPTEVTVNSTVDADGVWAIAVPAEPPPSPVIYPVVTPMTFKMLFTSSERIAIKRSVATDDVIDDWWGIINDPNLTKVNLGLKSAQDGLDYLISVGILAPERKEEILSGLVK